MRFNNARLARAALLAALIAHPLKALPAQAQTDPDPGSRASAPAPAAAGAQRRARTSGAPAAAAATAATGTVVQATSTVHVYEDTSGKFTPYNVPLRTGDRVTWHFPNASPGNAVVRRVATTGVWSIAPYTPGFANELAGPMIQAPSGVFALGPAGNGLVVQHDEECVSSEYEKAHRLHDGHRDYLCRTDSPNKYGRTMESTWSDPGITGVFIRLRWKDLQPGQNVWDDEILIRETDAAVAHGKLYSLVIESGRDGQPPWLTRPVLLGGLGLPSVRARLERRARGGQRVRPR